MMLRAHTKTVGVRGCVPQCVVRQSCYERLMHLNAYMNFTFYYLIFQLICIIYGLYLCFIMILGDNSQFPHLFGINPAEPENPFFHVFDFQGPNDVQMT